MTMSQKPKMGKKSIPKTPREAVLWIVNEVEKAFLKEEGKGNREIAIACADVKRWVEREWTLERETLLLEKEKLKWETAREEAMTLLGKDKWDNLEKIGDEIKLRLQKTSEQVEKDWFEFEETPEWKALEANLRSLASKGAAKANVVDLSKDVNDRVMSFLSSQASEKETMLSQILHGKLTLGSVMEIVSMELSKSIGVVPSNEKDEDKIPALGALIRFHNGKTAPSTPAALMTNFVDATPYCLEETKKLEEALCVKPGSKKYFGILVQKITEALTEAHMNQLLDALGELDPKGGGDRMTQLHRAFHDKDYVLLMKLLKSSALNGVTRLLPQLDLPPIEGNRDGVQYVVKNMDLSHFHVEENNVRLILKSALGQIKRGDPVVKVVIDDLTATIKGMQWSFKQEYFPYMANQGTANAKVTGVCVVIGFQLVKRVRNKVQSIMEKVTGEGPSSEETEVRKSGDTDDKAELVPQLVLGICRVHIDSVKLELEGSALMSWLTDYFANTIRTYASSLIQDIISEKITKHLETSNAGFAMHGWDLLRSSLDMDVSRLPSEEDAAKRAEQLDAPVGGRKDTYSVTFTNEGPMGLALGKWNEFVIVKSFKKAKDGSALPAELSGKIKVGDILVGFNGGEITSLPLDRVTTRISRSRRPLTLSFAPGDASSMEASQKRNHMIKFKFSEEKLFLLIKARPNEDRAAVVTGFRPTNPQDKTGEGAAEKAGVPVGWVLAAINTTSTLKKSFKDTMELFSATTARPIELKFVRDPDYQIEIDEAPADLKITSFEGGLVLVSGFYQLKSPAETLLGDTIQSGDFIVGIGNKDSTLMKFEDIVSLMRTSPRPVEIRFSRANANGVTSAASFGPGPLGMAFYKSSAEGKCCFKAFQGIEGPVERTKLVAPGHVLTHINGVAVTSEQQARESLLQAKLPVKLGFRDMEAYEVGGWKS